MKSRRDSIGDYRNGGREDAAACEEAAAREKQEVAIIERYLLKQLSEEETRDAIAALASELAGKCSRSVPGHPVC